MKFLNVLPFAILLICFCSNYSVAQEESTTSQENQEQEINKNLDEFAQLLSLTEEQKPQFKAISKKYLAKMMKVRDSDQGKIGKYKKVKSIRKKRNAEMKELLSEEQFKLYKEKQKELQKKMKENREKSEG